jgi:hypothetical protein
VRLINDRFGVDQTLPAAAGSTATKMLFSIPTAQAGTFPAGTYRVGAQVQLTGDPAPRDTNQLSLTIAPSISGLPMTVTRDGAGTASFALSFTPAVTAGQTATLVLGTQEFSPQTFTAPATTLNFVIPHAPVGDLLARLRIDSVESPVIDPSVTPPAYLNKRIKIQ